MKRTVLSLSLLLAVFLLTSPAYAANVYYSVGQNATNHSSGGNVYITSGVATFDTAQTATNLGVGDRLTYGGHIAYLSAKTSTSVWSVVTALGAAPDDHESTTVDSIAHEYTSLSAAEAGASDASHINNTNLITADVILNIPCYWDSAADTTAAVVDGWTTGVSNYIKIYTPNNTSTEVNQSQRHSGEWSITKYSLEPSLTTDSASLIVSDEFVLIEGLQIKILGSSSNLGGIGVYNVADGGDVRLSHNIIQGGVSGSGKGRYFGIELGVTTTATLRAWNNIIYNIAGGAGAEPAIWCDNTGGTLDAYNNTIYNCTVGLDMGGGIAFIAKNNIYQSNSISGADGYVGSFTSSDYNISDIASDAPSPSYRSGQATTVSFVNAGSYNFHLAANDTGAWSHGLNLVSGLVGYWKLDENPANDFTVIADSSGYGIDGVLMTNDESNKSVTGEIGQALSFDGVDDAFTTGENYIDLSSSAATTLSLWINYSPTSQTEFATIIALMADQIVLFGDATSMPPFAANSLFIAQESESGVRFVSYARPSSGWHYFTVVVDRSLSSNQESFYIDGVLQTPISIYTDGASTGTFGNMSLFLMGFPMGEVYNDNTIDDVRVYNRALSADEIQELYGLYGLYDRYDYDSFFTDDIDGEDRSDSGGTWDIGADDKPAPLNGLPCGSNITVNHTAGVVAPVTKSVTYGTVSTDLAGSTQCWITQNLGADHQAISATDDTEASAGWYWQFNRKQGYKHDGTTLTPSWTITDIDEDSDWTAANDPCTIELGAGWRLPTLTEWNNAVTNGAWEDGLDAAYVSVLRLHAAGSLDSYDGTLYGREEYGYGRYWSSTQGEDGSEYGSDLHIYENDTSHICEIEKAAGDSVRCLQDTALFTSSVIKQGGASVTIASAGDAGNNVWFAPAGTTVFAAGATMTTASGTATLILAPATEGDYKFFLIDAAGYRSNASTATLTVDNTAPTAVITYSDADGIVKSGDSLFITATFNESMADSPVPKISISGANTLSATDMVKYSDTVYNYFHTVGTGDGTATVALSVGTDLAGNVITSAPTSGVTFSVDNTSPVNDLPCGSSFTVNHTAGVVAPVTKSVTYGTVSTDLAGSTKCWITQNLGASHQATSVTDDTEASAGWYWQFNRKQGYKHDGTTLTPSWTITSIDEDSDWTAANDPCAIELGAGWRLPTYTEWENVDSSAWVGEEYISPYASALRLHAAGLLISSDGALYGRNYGVEGEGEGNYWGSTQGIYNFSGTGLAFYISGSYIEGYAFQQDNKPKGLGVRCLNDSDFVFAFFAPSVTKQGGASVTIASTGNAGNNVWFAPAGTTVFIAGDTMTTAGGTATSILAPADEGDYKFFVINAGGVRSLASTATLTVDNTAPTNQDTVFAANITRGQEASVTIVSSGDATNNIWFAPSGTTVFIAGDTMTTAAGTATSILIPATEGSYKLYVIDAAGNRSNASTATLTVDNTTPTNQDTVFASSVSKQGGVSVTIVSSGDATNNIWFAPSGTTVFIAGDTMTTAGGTTTSILAPANQGEYKLFIINAISNISNASTAILTVDNNAPINASCGESFTLTHTVGAVAPVTKTVTYGTVLGGGRCWITQNLGADHQATSVDDATEASAGWYWEFNRKQGYKHDGTTRTPNTAWVAVNEDTGFEPANDPCTLLFGTGWYVASYYNWIDTVGWGGLQAVWDSVLKVHAAGYLSDGFLGGRGYYGELWTSSPGNSTLNGILMSYWPPTSGGPYYFNKSQGANVRCVIDSSAFPVFASSVTKQGGASVTVNSSGDATNNIWFAPSGTTVFIAGDTMTTAAGTSTSILAPADEGAYKMFIIDAAGNCSVASTAILTVDNIAPNSPTNAAIVAGTGWEANRITVFNATAVKVEGNKSTDTVAIKIDIDDEDTFTNPKTRTLSGLGSGTTYSDATGIDVTTATALSDGNIAIRITAYDTAGNTSTQTISKDTATFIKDAILKNVYYSVGQNTDDHKSGGNVSITSGVATFTVAQTATNLGVGDRLTAGGNVYYLASKTDTTHWNVVTKLGATPADLASTAVTSIIHEYASLSLAEAGAPDSSHLNTSDLVASNYALNIPCYYDSGADTTAVTIDGWTTGVNNYIKIYTPNNTATEVNQSQRHSGEWNDAKYRLQSTSDVYGHIYVTEENVRIDGLQIKVPANGNNSGIKLTPSANQDHRISNCIIRGPATGTTDDGITVSGSQSGAGQSLIWNNIIYDFTGSTNGTGIVVVSYDSSIRFYNNTFINCATGISATVSAPLGTITTQNNLFKSCTAATSGLTGSASVDYNATDLSSLGYTAQSHDRVSQTFTFVNEGADDFHLASNDAGAKDFGVSDSGTGLFSDDIDGQGRHAYHWDIGADQVPRNLYFSVGQSALDHKTGTPTISISNGVATFSVAQTAVNMGVGDVITYTGGIISSFADGGGGTVTVTTASPHGFSNGDFVGINGTDNYDGQYNVFNVGSNDFKITQSYTAEDGGEDKSIMGGIVISGKNSTTSWNVAGVNGEPVGNASDKTVIAIVHAFQSLFDAAYGTDNYMCSVFLGSADLVAGNYILNIPCYYDTGADTNAVDITGWTTGASNYIKIYTPTNTSTECNLSQRHNGKWSDTKYRLEESLIIQNEYVRIEGLQIKFTPISTWKFGIGLGTDGLNSDIRISNNIIHIVSPDANLFTAAINDWSENHPSKIKKIWNNICYLTGDPADSFGIRSYSGTSYVYNNTAIGFSENYLDGAGTYIAKNNIAQSSGSSGFSGSFDSSSTNNSSDKNDAPGSNPKNGVTVTFADAPNYDFHLAGSDTVAKDYGTDLSSDSNLAFSTDIDSDTRPFGSSWDMGADQCQALTQEGFRFRNDDGTETTATWIAAQDTNINKAEDGIVRLRMLIDSTGVTASEQYQLEWRVSGGTWRKVE
jgi:hypothetical protein